VEAVKRGLTDDVIDVIATDHAPHSRWKRTSILRRPPSVSSAGNRTPLTLGLVGQGVLTLPQAVRKLSVTPPNLECGRGRLEEGDVADLVIIDPEFSYVLDAGEFIQSKNSPFSAGC